MIEIKNLTKRYGNKLIIDNLNIKFDSGKIIGILAPNGSGKTTLLKIIAQLSKQKSGEIIIDNKSDSISLKENISYLSDQMIYNKFLTVRQVAKSYELFFKDFDMDKFKRLLVKVQLEENMTIYKMSKGMLEKLALIVTLSRNAKVYIFDEPIAGVDMIARNQILNLIMNDRNENATVLITTHLIKDIEGVFDQVCYLNNGKIDKIYDVESLRETENESIESMYIKYFGGVGANV